MNRPVSERDAIEIIIVDDHALLRGLLVEAIAAVEGFMVIGEAADAEHATKLCAGLKPDVLVLDSILPGQNGAAAVEGILKVSPRTRILMFSGVTSIVAIRQALGNGARGFLPKAAPFTELVDGIRQVQAGHLFFGFGTQHIIENIMARSGPGRMGLNLSDREYDVLAGIARGQSSKEIASQLGRSAFTIENHRRRLMLKTGVNSIAQLTMLALELGLVDPVQPFQSVARPTS
jgi:DNA-binding NarL/FixJ family response regulator